MDHWQLFTFSVLGFNFLAIAVIGAILTRAARRDHLRKPKRATEPSAPKLTTAEAQAIVKGEMHPLEAWRLGAALSWEELGRVSKVAAKTLRQLETGEKSANQATRQAVIAAIVTGGATTAAQSTPSAHPATSANAPNSDAGSSSGSGTTGSDGGGGAF